MKKTAVWWMVFLLASCCLATTAVAQTTMQKEQMRQAGELDEEEEQEAGQQETQVAPRDASDEAATTTVEPEPEETRRGDEYVKSETSWVHLPGLRFDWGGTVVEGADENPTAVGLGLGYMYAWEWDVEIVRSESMLRVGAGPELTFVTMAWERLDGITTYMTGRVAGVGPRGGLAIETGGGLAVGRGGLRPMIKAGAFLATRVFEIGYFFQTPLVGTRADWVTTHHLGLRLHIPLLRH